MVSRNYFDGPRGWFFCCVSRFMIHGWPWRRSTWAGRPGLRCQLLGKSLNNGVIFWGYWLWGWYLLIRENQFWFDICVPMNPGNFELFFEVWDVLFHFLNHSLAWGTLWHTLKVDCKHVLGLREGGGKQSLVGPGFEMFVLHCGPAQMDNPSHVSQPVWITRK